MSKHTPGPWSVSINQAVSDSGSIKTLTGADHYSDPVGGEFFKPYVAVVGADGSVICDNAQYYAQDIDPKNVNLIATAPDLLSALEECLPCLGWEHDSDDELKREHEQGNGYAELILRARAAIAKARAK